MSFLSVSVTTKGTYLAIIPNLSSTSKQLQRTIYSPTQPTWKQHLSATQEMCKNVFENLITIFPNQLTPDKQDTLKKELKIDNDATLKMIVVMHFIVSKNVRCFKKKRAYIPTIDLMKTIDSVLFSDVNDNTIELYYLKNFHCFDTPPSINDDIKRFSSEVIGKYKVKDTSTDYSSIGDTPKERNYVLYLAYGIKDTV